MSFILALDEGTTSARAIVFDETGTIRGLAQREFKQYFPQDGWVEHDASEIWFAQHAVAKEALAAAKLAPKDVSGIGITNQRETTVVWDRATGEPIHHAIVWQDRRTAPMCDQLKADGAAGTIQERTGLLIDAYFSGTKLAWLLDHVPGARAKAEAGQLAFGTIDTWLAWKLTGGKLHITDATNASRTLLMNLKTGQWDDEMLKLFRIPRAVLPEIRATSEVYGPVAGGLGLDGLQLASLVGDQQSALFGQLCLQPGQGKNTYGTGCFLLQTIGEKPIPSKQRLLTTVAWQLGKQLTYALEGSVFIGGAVVQWLRDGLNLIRNSAEVNTLAQTVPDSGGVFFVPAFAGLGAPHWDSYARGTIVGLTRGTTAGHLARAALESIAFQVADLLEAMRLDTGKPAKDLRVDGGASQSDLLMQMQADLLQIPVIRPKVTETTALGAAYLAGLATGVWKSPETIAQHQPIDRTFEPKAPADKVAGQKAAWQRAVERAKGWVGG